MHQVPLWAWRGLCRISWTHHFLFFFVLHLRIDVEAWDLPWGKIYSEATYTDRTLNLKKDTTRGWYATICNKAIFLFTSPACLMMWICRFVYLIFFNLTVNLHDPSCHFPLKLHLGHYLTFQKGQLPAFTRLTIDCGWSLTDICFAKNDLTKDSHQDIHRCRLFSEKRCVRR